MRYQQKLTARVSSEAPVQKYSAKIDKLLKF